MEDDPKIKTDEQLLQITKDYDGVLVTNDVALKVIAINSHIKTQGYSWEEDYTGIYYLDVGAMTMDIYNSTLASLHESGIYEPEDYTFSQNEYLVVPPPYEDASLGKYSIFRYDGISFNPVHIKEIESNWTSNGKPIKPRNIEQACLIDAITDKSINIVYAGGNYGTGKSYLTHHYAINQLEKGAIKKIIYVPNNSYTQNTMDLGALPGTLVEKVQPILGPLIDIVGIDNVLHWMDENQLEVVPVGYIRGRNFEESIVIVSEAENLTEEHIKLLVARCGEGTRIFFDGDIHQADSAIFKDRNGLKLLLKLHESGEFSKIFSTVQLSKIERSFTAAAADYLDRQ